MSDRLRFSIVIPTYQRRELVVEAVRSADAQDFELRYEIVVVVDGSTDGTGEAVAALRTTHPLRVIEQVNSGLAETRNRGATAARGEVLLFIDDDMRLDAGALAAHDTAHAAGADLVMGAIPVHPDSPGGVLRDGISAWATERHERLLASTPSVEDLLGGHLSIGAEQFARLGGFDTSFTAGGTYGNEDLDFGHRVQAAGLEVVYAPDAISHQLYDVALPHYLQQYMDAGAADVALVRKHPSLADEIFADDRWQSRMRRWLRGPVLAAPGLFAWVVRWLGRVLQPAARRSGAILSRAVYALRAMAYWTGVASAGGPPQREARVRVLAYHAVADLGSDGILAPYGVLEEQFTAHLDHLQESNVAIVGAEEFLEWLRGERGLPRRSVLVTFDDCYTDLRTVALHHLTERGIPAVAFAVSGQIGGENLWDQRIGARPLSLLGAEDLLELAAAGVEIGSHGRTHRPLSGVSREVAKQEVGRSAEDLERIGLPRPRLFSYPHGEHGEAARGAVRAAGYEAAFTVEPGLVTQSDDRTALRRIEVLRRHHGWRFRALLATAGRWGS